MKVRVFDGIHQKIFDVNYWFDGDEMNIHLAQSIQARNELKRIANVKFQIIGVKDSNPIIGCQQDALSGAFLLTQKDVKIKGSDAANILCNTTSDTKFNVKMDKEYSGHEVFYLIINEAESPEPNKYQLRKSLQGLRTLLLANQTNMMDYAGLEY